MAESKACDSDSRVNDDVESDMCERERIRMKDECNVRVRVSIMR